MHYKTLKYAERIRNAFACVNDALVSTDGATVQPDALDMNSDK